MIQGGEAPYPYPAPSLPQEMLWEFGTIGDHRGLCHPHASGCTFWEQKQWGRAGVGGWNGDCEHGGGVCGSQREHMAVPLHLCGRLVSGSQLPVRHSLHVPESSSLALLCHHRALAVQGKLGDPPPAWGRGRRDSGAVGSVGVEDSTEFRSAVPLGPIGTNDLECTEWVCICSLPLRVSSEEED